MGTVVLAAILSIPTGIVVALLAPRIQRWLESRGRDNDLKRELRATEERHEYKRILTYKENPSDFIQYLVYVAVKIAFISAIMTVLSGLIFVIGQGISLLGTFMLSGFFLEQIERILYPIGQLATVIGALIILNVARPALRTWTRVKNFDEYEKSVQGILDNRDA